MSHCQHRYLSQHRILRLTVHLLSGQCLIMEMRKFDYQTVHNHYNLIIHSSPILYRQLLTSNMPAASIITTQTLRSPSIVGSPGSNMIPPQQLILQSGQSFVVPPAIPYMPDGTMVPIQHGISAGMVSGFVSPTNSPRRGRGSRGGRARSPAGSPRGRGSRGGRGSGSGRGSRGGRSPLKSKNRLINGNQPMLANGLIPVAVTVEHNSPLRTATITTQPFPMENTFVYPQMNTSSPAGSTFTQLPHSSPAGSTFTQLPHFVQANNVSVAHNSTVKEPTNENTSVIVRNKPPLSVNNETGLLVTNKTLTNGINYINRGTCEDETCGGKINLNNMNPNEKINPSTGAVDYSKLNGNYSKDDNSDVLTIDNKRKLINGDILSDVESKKTKLNDTDLTDANCSIVHTYKQTPHSNEYINGIHTNDITVQRVDCGSLLQRDSNGIVKSIASEKLVSPDPVKNINYSIPDNTNKKQMHCKPIRRVFRK